MKRTIRENEVFTFFRPRKDSIRGRLRAFFRDRFYMALIRLCPAPAGPPRPHHISLCLMFKDEAPYLREWIEYHRLIGADHFYLYDNNSSDGFEEVIRPYVEEGLVTLIRWTAEHAQTAGYEDCIRRFRSESDWIGFIDVDEFLVPVAEDSLVTFLARFSRCPAVLVYWRFFGSGGRLERDPSRLVTEDFVVASEKLYDKGKCFYNADYEYLFGDPKNRSMFHYLWTAVRGIPAPPVDVFGRIGGSGWYAPPRRRPLPVQLNHYAVKSLAEHREKDKKGDVYYDHPTHGDDVFFMREKRCSVPDYRIYRYLTALKVRLRERERPS